MNRYIFNEHRKQAIIKRRLHEADARKGPRLPAIVPVTLESLQRVHAELQRVLGEPFSPDISKLN